MKKAIMLSILSMMAFVLLGQDHFEFAKRAKIAEVSKPQLVERASTWQKEIFGENNSVMLFEQNGISKMSGSGTFEYDGIDHRYNGLVSFQFEASISDGRIEYRFFDFRHSGHSGQMGFVTNDAKAPFTGFGKRRNLNREWKHLQGETNRFAKEASRKLEEKLKHSKSTISMEAVPR